MSLTPPDLGRPYSTEAERAADREAALLYWDAIKVLTKLANQPASEWTPQQAGLFPRSGQGGPPEAPGSPQPASLSGGQLPTGPVVLP